MEPSYTGPVYNGPGSVNDAFVDDLLNMYKSGQATRPGLGFGLFGSRTRKADRRSEVKPIRGGRIWKKKEWFATKYTPQPQTRRREQFSPILLFTHPF